MITEALVTDDGAIVALEAAVEETPRAIGLGLDAIAEGVSKAVDSRIESRTTRRGFHSGLTPLSEAYEEVKATGPYTRIVGPAAPFYAGMLDEGFTAVGNPFLTFFADGSWHRVRSVTVEGRHFISESMDEADRTAPEILSAELVKVTGLA